MAELSNAETMGVARVVELMTSGAADATVARAGAEALSAFTQEASEEEWAARKAAWKPPELVNQTPWQALHRQFVGQLDRGGCLDFAVDYQRISTTFGVPRDNH